jgi:Cu-Zn family superoxide dismutase
MNTKLFCIFAAVAALQLATVKADILYASAIADIHGIGSLNSLGSFFFDQYMADDGETLLGVDLSTLLKGIYPTGEHGFHIHEFPSDIKCELIGHHINPFHVNHGKPENDYMHRHIGDLGNLLADDQGIMTDGAFDTIIQIGTGNETFDIIGRSVAIHITFDDFGVGAADPINTMGNAGPMVACGTINLVSNLSKIVDVNVTSADDYGSSHGALRFLQYNNATTNQPLHIMLTGTVILPAAANKTVAFVVNTNAADDKNKCFSLGDLYSPTGASGVIGFVRVMSNGRADVSFTTNDDNMLQVDTGDSVYDVKGHSVGIYVVDQSTSVPPATGGLPPFDATKATIVACANI